MRLSECMWDEFKVPFYTRQVISEPRRICILNVLLPVFDRTDWCWSWYDRARLASTRDAGVQAVASALSGLLPASTRRTALATPSRSSCRVSASQRSPSACSPSTPRRPSQFHHLSFTKQYYAIRCAGWRYNAFLRPVFFGA